MKSYLFWPVVLCFVLANSALAQNDSLIIDSPYKNAVYYNISNPIIFGGKSVIFGYQRVLKNNFTASLNLGHPSYPRLLFNGDSMVAYPESKEKGFHVSAELRKYLTKENKYAAPHGIYLGGYASTNNFNRTNYWLLSGSTFQGEVETDMTINIHSMGIELGYQFVFWKRWTLDMVLMGPGVAFYNVEFKVNRDLTIEENEEFYQALGEYLKENFPGFGQLLDEDEFSATGATNTLSLGFRYVVTVGFRF